MPDVEFCRWDQLASDPEHERLSAELDHVFFSSSARQSFASTEERAAFRERWLGRYLLHFPEYALVALDGGRHVIGYVAGSLEDPAHDPLFADLDHFAHFGALTARYPAQLHVNLDAGWRGRGIGARLVDRFAEMAREAGKPGLHVVTARGMRNVGFYLANGFVERGAVDMGERELLFLGRDL
ncbi:GNAT family N-acetyltransferase [Hyphomicrobium sp.]|uniref:GNAT family N-acetyltransferase n=1 Tax=Hyphomicrobium sp. TaxID=82 RepID=UPI0025BDCC65|nr:GNAT family N-acetyltransferase [Hyphomicrobium sp.]MCC7252621.1 GNAT family N-acetyltransferase [Hyphomicrobium sp.]